MRPGNALLLATGLALALPAAGADGPAPAGAPATPETSGAPAAQHAAAPTPAPPAAPSEVQGLVRSVDRARGHVEVEGPRGPAQVVLDRNTMVYTPAGLGTVLDVKPGAQVRAGKNAKGVAFWIQVRADGPAAGATPGQGTGPGGGSGPPSEPGTGLGPAAPPAGSSPPSTVPGTSPGGP